MYPIERVVFSKPFLRTGCLFSNYFEFLALGHGVFLSTAAASSLKAFLAQFPCKGPLRGCFLY